VVDLDFFYGNSQVLWSVSLNVRSAQITALIGPPGAAIHLFALPESHERHDRRRPAVGQILLDDKNVLDPAMNVLSCADAWAWSFSGPTVSAERLRTMWPLVRACWA